VWSTLTVITLLLSAAFARAETITIGTSAPRHSPWGKVFRVWNMALKKKTDGELRLKFYWNNQQGSEPAMIGKMRAGQLDGAAFTAVGLAEIHKPILALQAPGLFYDWETLDRVRDALAPELQAAAEKKGFYIAGWGDIGLHYIMATHAPIRSVGDLKATRSYRLFGDDNLTAFAQAVGATSVPMSVAEVLPNLSAGRVNVCQAPALAAEQLQWAPQFEYVTDRVLAAGIGAIVLSNRSLDRLSDEHRALLKKTARKAGKMLTKRIRALDRQAYERIKGRMTVVKPSVAEWAEWEKSFAAARKRLSQGTYDAAFMARLEKLAGK
jgi:TRAP-type C4-dicarboxylate transport system substrate-binding protein